MVASDSEFHSFFSLHILTDTLRLNSMGYVVPLVFYKDDFGIK